MCARTFAFSTRLSLIGVSSVAVASAVAASLAKTKPETLTCRDFVRLREDFRSTVCPTRLAIPRPSVRNSIS